MITAPQDSYGIDLARDLGGWSDDAIMKELSRRATLHTDDEHEVTSTGAGTRIAHRSRKPTVTYDAATAKFTVTTFPYRILMLDKNIASFPTSAGYTPNKSDETESTALAYTFDKLGSNYTVFFGWDRQQNSFIASDFLQWSVDIASTVTTDAVTETMESAYPHNLGMFHPFFSVTLRSDGTATVDMHDKPIDFLYSRAWGNRPMLTVDAVTKNVYFRNVSFYDDGNDSEGAIPLPPNMSGTNGDLIYGRVEGPGPATTYVAAAGEMLHFREVMDDSPNWSIVIAGPVLANIETDASSNVTAFTDYTQNLHMEQIANMHRNDLYTGSIPSGSTIEVKNGHITGYS